MHPTICITPQEDFVTGVYAELDAETASCLHRLRNDEGIVPVCKAGCCHCCRYLILSNSAEAHALAQHIKREFSEEQINALRTRTQQWHAWDNSRPGRFPSGRFPLTDADIPTDEQIDLSTYEPCCPLLLNGKCSAYPVRPVVCRRHYVSSPPQLCQAANDPSSALDPPVVLTAVVASSNRFSLAIQAHIENAGEDFSRSIVLLPHGLATEMGWEFAISSDAAKPKRTI